MKSVMAWLSGLALLGALAPSLALGQAPEPFNDKSYHPLKGYMTRTGTVSTKTERRSLGAINNVQCDGTCNNGKPCICPPGCTCREPTCLGTHYMRIRWESIQKTLRSAQESITSKTGASLSASVSGKAGATIPVSRKGGDDVPVKVSGGGEAKGKVEGYKKGEKGEKESSSSSLTAGGSIEIGTKDHAKRGYLMTVNSKATLVLTYTLTQYKWEHYHVVLLTPVGYSSGEVREVSSMTFGVEVEDNTTYTPCPCRSLEPKDGERNVDPSGGGKATPGRKPKPPGSDGPAKKSGVFLGGGSDRSHVAIRTGPGGSGKPVTVRVNGRPVDPEDVKTTPAKTDPTITVVTVRHGDNGATGARITVTDGRGDTHEAERPPDRVQIFNRVTVKRSTTTTTVTVAPQVKTRSPDGKETEQPPGTSPTGKPPATVLKDDDGFWKGVSDFFFKTVPGVLVPVATGFLLNPGASGGRVVKTLPDGSTEVEVPNEVFDKGLETARRSNPDFGPGDVAGSVETGLGLTEGPNPIPGLAIVDYFVVGGSPFEVRSGSQVVFTLRTGGTPAVVTPASVQVALWIGAPVGFFAVDAVSPLGKDKVVVSATLTEVPPGVESFQARATVGGRSSNTVPFRVAPGAVSLVAVQKIVLEGNAVTLVLHAEGGMAIKGTLTITGPGTFTPQGGQSVRVDACGKASFTVATSDPGLINATFTPDEPGGSFAGQLSDLGLTEGDLVLDK